MKPRIFVSSTFYDLKHIREELSHFIRSYYFDPVLFEDGDVGYIPSLHLDESCYQTIDTCDMVILIIGGNYGTIATSPPPDDEYFPKLISITRREYRKAVECNIPIFVFVDKAVYAEYNIYQLNKEAIEKNHVSMVFSATKDINVFKFIDEIKNIGIYSITEFDQFATIQNFLQKQWADFFKTHLRNLRKDKEHQIIKSGIDEINGLIRKLNDISDNILRKVAPDDYSEIEQKMNDTAVLNHLKNICSTIAHSIEIVPENYQDADGSVRILLDGIKAISNNTADMIAPLQSYLEDNNSKVISIELYSAGLACKQLNELIQEPELYEQAVKILSKPSIYEQLYIPF